MSGLVTLSISAVNHSPLSMTTIAICITAAVTLSRDPHDQICWHSPIDSHKLCVSLPQPHTVPCKISWREASTCALWEVVHAGGRLSWDAVASGSYAPVTLYPVNPLVHYARLWDTSYFSLSLVPQLWSVDICSYFFKGKFYKMWTQCCERNL